MTTPESSISSEDLKKLREFYIGTIPEKLELIEKLIQEMETTVYEKTLIELRMHIHKIAGSAGTYGFPTVSVICRQFEGEILKKIEEIKNSSGDPTWMILFRSYLKKIKKEFCNV